GGGRREARWAVRPLHHAHQQAEGEQARESGGETRRAGEQREKEDNRNEHLAMPDRVREPAAEDGEEPPRHAEDADNGALILDAQPEIIQHEREEWRNDPAVEADEAEAEAEQRDGLPLVRSIPAVRGTHSRNGVTTTGGAVL